MIENNDTKSVDILFVYPPTGWSEKAMNIAENDAPPLGLLYVAASARNAGYKVSVIDMNHPSTELPELIETVSLYKPKIIGFSVLTPSAPITSRLIKGVRQVFPEIAIVVGGIHATVLPESMLDCGANIAVIGEGEDAIIDIARAVFSDGKLSGIPGIVYSERQEEKTVFRAPKRRLRTALDSIPFPSRDLVPIKEYGQPGAISGSRGCPYSCSFCSSVTTQSHKYRARSVNSVIAELDHMHENYQMSSFQFFDDNFAGNPVRAMDLTSRLKKRSYIWSCQTTIMEFTENLNLLDSMYESGCREIYFGLESGSERVIKSYKHIDLGKAMEVLIKSAEIGSESDGQFKTVVGFIVGHPEDDEDSIRDSVDLAIKLRGMGIHTMISLLQPYPGSPIHKRPDKFGVNILNTDYSQYLYPKANIETKHLSSRELTNLYSKGLLKIINTYGD